MSARHTSLIHSTVIALLVVAPPLIALQVPEFEGTAHGFPVLRDAAGKKLADGDFSQWLEGDQLHVRIRYTGRDRRIEEKAVFRQRPRLSQTEWSLREARGGKLYRQFEVHFGSGKAAAKKLDEGEFKEWSEKIDVEPGRTFAGFGFTLAIKGLRGRLMKGERIELQAVGFTPKPRVVPVEVSYSGLNEMRMSDRVLRADRFDIHPKIPFIAELFVKVPDTQIWLTSPPPAGFLRWEGPLAEPSDPLIRVDLLPGGQSGPAKPVKTSGRPPPTRPL